MKKIIIILVVLIVIVLAFFAFNNVNKTGNLEDNSSEEQIVLVEKSYTNYAWGFQYKGSIILSDGSIYDWDFNGTLDEFTDKSLEDKMNWIKEIGNKRNSKVSSSDIAELKANIEILEDIDFKTTQTAYDAGSKTTYVWKYDLGSLIGIETSGDFTGANNTGPATKIRKIVNKYIK